MIIFESGGTTGQILHLWEFSLRKVLFSPCL